MTRSFVLPLALMVATFCLSSASDLPKSDDTDSLDIEPPLLIPNRDIEKPNDAAKNSSPAADPEKLERDFERAKRNAAGVERLCKIGAIAQVEAEQRVLRVARIGAQLEDARMALAKENFAREEARVANREITKSDLAEVEAELAHAIEAAHAAAQNRQHAELEFAENNVRRQQKLVALGSGSKSEVNRAEQKLAELKAAKENN